jgi:predicted dehydrogenase
MAISMGLRSGLYGGRKIKAQPASSISCRTSARLCRLGRGELRQVQERFGFPFATQVAAALVRQPGLDGVLVTSPHTLHYEHARLALERGLHVLCDKPMCTRAEHARELVRLAREKNLHLLVPYGWHYKPFVQEARRWLDAGAVGVVQYVTRSRGTAVRQARFCSSQTRGRGPIRK